MSNIFTLTKEQANDHTFGNNDVKKLCDILGFKIIDKEMRWGSIKAEYRSHKFDVCKQRNLNEIRLYIDCGYSNQEKIRDLTEKKLLNLKTRIDAMVDEKNASNKARDNRQAISSKLYELGISVWRDSFSFKGFKFSLTEEKTFKSYESKEVHEYLRYSDDLADARVKLDEAFLEFSAKKEKFDDAIKELENHKDLVLSYYGNV